MDLHDSVCGVWYGARNSPGKSAMKLAVMVFIVLTGVNCQSLSYVQPEDYEEDDLADVEPDYRYSGLDGFLKPMGPEAPKKKKKLTKARK